MELIDILTVIIGRHHPYYIYVVKFTGKESRFTSSILILYFLRYFIIFLGFVNRQNDKEYVKYKNRFVNI
jgi:hypothetical protein